MMVKKFRYTYQIKISLNGIRPPIWRRVLVPDITRLDTLHHIFQDVMGWTNSHLHQFCDGNSRYGILDPDFTLDDDLLEETKYCVKDLLREEGACIIYEYDFGDDWQHTVELEKILPFDQTQKLPFCADGRRSCPPEDVGGVWGYQEFLQAYMDSTQPQHEEFREWAGDDFHPGYFEKNEVNKILCPL